MRITVISTPVFQLGSIGLCGYGGLEQIAWECARGLAAKGHEVSLVAPDGSECPGVTMLHCGPAGRVDERFAYNKYWEKLLEVDVVIDHSWQKCSYLLKMEQRLKAPILGVLHAPVNTMYSSLPPVENPCFVCISQDQCNHFDALFSPRTARTCYNGIDLDFYKPALMRRTDRYLFLARFSSIKSPDVAQDVCIAANKGLDLVGDISITQEPQYLELIKSKADGSLIRFVGPATRAECVLHFSKGYSLLHPTRSFREPFGLAPVEAQACGCVPVAWRYGACSETIKHGETGFLVRSVQEMIDLVKNDAVSTINRNYCREWAAQFSVQRMVNRYEELCKEALDTGGW